VLYGGPKRHPLAALSFDKPAATATATPRARPPLAGGAYANPSAEHRWELIKITSPNDNGRFLHSGLAPRRLATHVACTTLVQRPRNDPPARQTFAMQDRGTK